MYNKFQYEANDGYHAVVFGDYHGWSQCTGYEVKGTACIRDNAVDSSFTH